MPNIQKRGEQSFLLAVDIGFKGKKRIRRTRTIKIEDKSLLRTTKRLQEHLEKEWYKFKTEIEVGEYISPEKMTVSQFIPDWEKKYAEKHLSESTLDVYIRHIENHIKPTFGDKRLDQVLPIHVVNFLSELGDKELSVGTIQYIYRVLRNIFSRAVEWKIIKDNPVAAVRKPKETKKKKEPSVYDENEVAKLFESVHDEPFHWRMFITLALAAGLRRGELLGLEWSHINFKDGTIHIQQTLGRGRDGRAVLKEPKSATSDRIISLSNSVIEELKVYQAESFKERDNVVDLFKEKEHDFLFRNEDGTHFYPTTPTTWWRRFIDKINDGNENPIRYIRLHDLRHTSATLLINQGVHAKIISERLGHADIRITMDTYGHALRSADQEAANKLDNLFKKSL
jgi:integrase